MYLNLREVLRPQSLRDCLAALDAPATVALAGGTCLGALEQPEIERLVDLQDLPLGGIEARGDGVRIGAMTRLGELTARALPPPMAALAQAARAERNLPVRNQSTIGGRLGRCRADARIATALLALRARVELATLEGGEVATREVGIADCLAGGEGLITAVLLPGGVLASAYRDFGLTAVDVPTTDVAVARLPGGDLCIASGGHGADGRGVVRTSGPEGAGIPRYTDARAGGIYRQAVATTLVRRLVAELEGAEAGR